MIMDIASLLTNGGAGIISSAVVVAAIEGLFNRGGRRADAATKLAQVEASEAETLKKDHELWRAEAKEAYAQAKLECSECKQELREAKQEHEREIERMNRELNDIRDALVARLDAIDEMLPYVSGMPADKIDDIRAANRVVRKAIWRG